MANDCSNRLQIYCANEQLLERTYELFYQKEDGEIQYTMMKLVPIPPDDYDSKGNPLFGFFKPMGYWGTRSNFWSPKPTKRKNEFSGGTKPKIFIKHQFDICQVQTAGYMFWKPGLEMKYEYSTEEDQNEKIINEFKTIEEERQRELEIFEFHLEDYLEEEPYGDDFEYRFQRYGWDMPYFD